MPRYVINPKSSATIMFAATEAGLTAGTNGTFQITSFTVAHSANSITVPATFGAPASEDLAMSSYSLELEYLQDYGINAASFSAYLWNQEGETVWFSIEPSGDIDAVAGLKGQCVIPGSDYGGAADEPWIATVSCPCPTKPTLVPDV